MLPRFVSLPDEGFYFQSGQKPEWITVNEVPVAVPDEDLKALVAVLCAGQGLALGLGEGPAARPAFSKNYRELLRLAVKRAIPLPGSMAEDAEKMRPAGSPKPGRGGIIDL
jgi:hypothetical protein